MKMRCKGKRSIKCFMLLFYLLLFPLHIIVIYDIAYDIKRHLVYWFENKTMFLNSLMEMASFVKVTVKL